MAYNFNTFLKPLNDGDKNVMIFNESGELIYTVNPFSILNVQVRGNIITISVKSGRTILLDFLNSNLALNALPLLQNRINQLTNEAPNFIDKQIEKWTDANTGQRIGQIISSPSFSFGSASFNNIIPSQDDFFSIGSVDYKWSELYVNSAYIDNPQFDFNSIIGIPFERTTFDRFVNTQMDDPHGDNPKVGQDIIIRDANMYFDGTASLRFTNFDGTASHKLISVWDWDGPLGSTHTIYPEFEDSYYERAQLSFKIEDSEKSSVSLKSFDWSVGSQSSIEHEYKFYEGDIVIAEGKGLYSGGLKFSSRITGTSTDLLEVLPRGTYFELNTQKYLSFQRGTSVIVSNGLEDFYVDDDYFDDATAAVMIGIVDSYNESTGLMGIYVETPIGIGRTASNWSINISGRQVVLSENPGGLTGPQGFQGPQGSGGVPVVLNESFTSSFVITITHSFGYYPVVQIIDDNYQQIIPQLILHNSLSNFTVTFATQTSGIVITGGGTEGPNGQTGTQGPAGTGPQGWQGEIGPQGFTGLQGETGPQGFQGDTGPQGYTGPQGELGPQGNTGVQGDTGPQGLQGFTGPQGLQGFTGPQGNIGPVGPTGSAPILYLLEAYANETYTLPGSFTDDTCRYSIVNNTVNVPSGWFNTSTYRFTPQKAGYWEITASYDVYRNSEASLAIRKNGGVVAAAGSFNAVAQTVTKIVYLNGSTDYVDAMNTGGASLSRNQYDSRSWFQARWIGE